MVGPDLPDLRGELGTDLLTQTRERAPDGLNLYGREVRLRSRSGRRRGVNAVDDGLHDQIIAGVAALATIRHVSEQLGVLGLKALDRVGRVHYQVAPVSHATAGALRVHAAGSVHFTTTQSV